MTQPSSDRLRSIVDAILAGQAPRSCFAEHAEAHPNTTEVLQGLRTFLEKNTPLDVARSVADKLLDDYPNTFVVIDLYCNTRGKDFDRRAMLSLRSRAASLQPRNMVASVRLAEAYGAVGRNDMALKVLASAIDLGLNEEFVAFKAGYYASMTGDHETALSHYQSALSKRVMPRTLLNMAAAARLLGRSDLSAESSRRAMLLAPDSSDPYYNFANLKRELGDAEEAVRQNRRAERINPKNGNVTWNLSHALLATGDFKAGFETYRNRWYFRGFPTRIRHPEITNVKDLESLSGRVFVYTEQGMGDNMLFARFIPELIARLPDSASATFECYPSLSTLFQNTFPDIDIRPYQFDLPTGYDYYLPLFDIPWLLGTSSVSDQEFPYLFPSTRTDLPTLTEDRPRVGIVWAGNPKFSHDKDRSASIDDLTGLLNGLDCSLFCLQKGVDEGLVEKAYPGVVDLAGHLSDFDATANLINQMDYIVSTCTSAANLAGALGKPGLVVTGPARDWRWMTGSACDWYPSLRIVQRPRTQDWRSFFVDIQPELSAALETL